MRTATAYPLGFEIGHKLPRPVVLATAVHERNLCKHLFQVRLRLLRPFAQQPQRPMLALAEEGKEHIQELVAWYTCETLELAFGWFRFASLYDKSEGKKW